jgi:DNA-binding CsgD family transcriptional regulator
VSYQPFQSTYMAARRVLPRIHAIPAPKTSILRFAEAIDSPVVLTSRDGRLAWMNAPARDFFVGPTGTRLRQLVEAAVRIAANDRRKGTAGLPNPARHFEIGHERFHATIVVAGNDLASQDVGAMVTLRREAIANPPHVSEHSLTRRFNLTPQEARVAILLAERRSNSDVAARLGISVHTARHHTERVLAKLEIHSRHDVRKAISA